MKLDSASLKGLLGDTPDDDQSENNPSSEGVRDTTNDDPAPHRGEENEKPLIGKVVISATDKRKILGMISTGIQGLGLMVAMKCEDCGQTISDAEGLADAITNVVCKSQRRVEWFLAGGSDSMDMIMLVTALTPVVAQIAHHHVSFLQDRTPDPAEGFDPLQPEVPWQP
jgi:hypothetical protein